MLAPAAAGNFGLSALPLVAPCCDRYHTFKHTAPCLQPERDIKAQRPSESSYGQVHMALIMYFSTTSREAQHSEL